MSGTTNGDPFALTPGESGPLSPEVIAALPHDNAATRLNVSIWFLVGLAAIFLCLRVYCKFLRMRKLWWDDAILIASFLVLVAFTSVVSYLTSLGYGKHTWDFDIAKLPDFALGITVAGTLVVTAAIWSKMSFCFTILRLTEGWMSWLVIFIIVSTNVFMGASAIFPWVVCKPLQKGWNPLIPGECTPGTIIIHFNIFTGSWSALMDFALSLLPWKLLWGLQMQGKERVGVIIAMSMGIFAGITSIVKISKLETMLSLDMQDNVDIFIWACAEVSVTIMAASIPILRSLFRELRTSSERSNQNLAPPFPQKLSSNYINIALSDRSDRSSTKPPRTPTEV